MVSYVTERFLLKGYAYALEQCGCCLRDANILYGSGSYANTVALAAFAFEELGRSTICLASWRNVLAGANITLEEMKKRCSDPHAHNRKQQAGMLSIVLTGEDDPEFGKWLRIKMEADRQSPEWQRAETALARIHEDKRNSLPKKRHEARKYALYVDPESESEWRRPGETISPSYAKTFLLAAVNDYATRYHHRYLTSDGSDGSALQHREPDLYRALSEWPDRPELPQPEWPPISSR